jgi:hypothetical protein
MRFRKKTQSAPPILSATPASPSPPKLEVEVTYSGSAFPLPGGMPSIEPVAVPALPHEDREEPVRALKAAYVLASAHGAAFYPLNKDNFPAYAAQATAQCCCQSALSTWGYTTAYTTLGLATIPTAGHRRPQTDSSCGFYAWKRDTPFPWQAGTWLLEVDLYGRVIEHDAGYRAEKQRILSISPVPGSMCTPPFTLALGADGSAIQVFCEDCLVPRGHAVSPDRLRQLLGVEVDVGRAGRMRGGEAATRAA